MRFRGDGFEATDSTQGRQGARTRNPQASLRPGAFAFHGWRYLWLFTKGKKSSMNYSSGSPPDEAVKAMRVPSGVQRGIAVYSVVS